MAATTPQGVPSTSTCDSRIDLDREHVLVPTSRATVPSAGLLHERRRLAQLTDRAVGEDRDAVAQAEGLLGPMRDVDDGGGAVAQRRLQIIEERAARFGVESGGGLIEKQQPWIRSRGRAQG